MLDVPAHRLSFPDSWNVTLKPSIGVGVLSNRRILTGRVTHGFEGQITVAVDGAPTVVYQPMSHSWPGVKSRSTWRSVLIAGSIRAFGVSETSQCDTDEPLWNGLGVYIFT